jgi:hypothetical protein
MESGKMAGLNGCAGFAGLLMSFLMGNVSGAFNSPPNVAAGFCRVA